MMMINSTCDNDKESIMINGQQYFIDNQCPKFSLTEKETEDCSNFLEADFQERAFYINKIARLTEFVDVNYLFFVFEHVLSKLDKEQLSNVCRDFEFAVKMIEDNIHASEIKSKLYKQ